MEKCMKSEEGSGKRVISAETKPCVKRRRRSPSLATLGCGETQNPASFQLGQAPSGSATTTTTTKRSSRFRGVSRHRWTGRYEAHLWDKGTWNPTQKKKGKQVYLGAYDEEEAAARAYDLAAIKYWGTSTYTNFPIADYEKEIEIMQSITKEEYLASLRRRSSGFARGVSKYRGVARHHHNGRWEARIGRVFGNKYLYLGTYGTQEEAAHAYDIAAIEYRGINAVTNFDLSTYIRWLRPTDDHGASPEAYKGLTLDNAVQQPDSAYTTMNLNRDLAILNTNSFALTNPAISQKHEIIERKMPLSPSNGAATSPTALGLLLRSSLYKEMVEKTTMRASAANEDDCKEEKVREEGVFEFYGVKGENGVLEADVPPLYNETGQGIWNGIQYGR